MDNPISNQPKEDYSSYTEYVEQSINDVLPDHILSQIFSYLSFHDFREVTRTCMMWRRICFTIQSALSAFEISDEMPVECAMSLFTRFVEWRIGSIRKVNIHSINVFTNCGHKFTGVKFLEEASSMALTGFPNIERVKELEITSTFFGDMYKYPGLESIKFLKFKDAVIDFFHCSLFGLTLVESLLPLIDFEKVDSLKLVTNSKLLNSLACYAKENIQSKANLLFQNINSKIKYLRITLAEESTEDDDFEGEVDIPLSNLEELYVEFATVRTVNMLHFDPEKLKRLQIGSWHGKHTIENPLQPRVSFELFLVSEFHQLLNRSAKIQTLVLDNVKPLFYRTFAFSQFKNLTHLHVAEMSNSNLTQLAPKLQVLKVGTITEFNPEIFKLFGSLKELEMDPKYASKIDFKDLPKLSNITLQSFSAHYSMDINSDSLKSIRVMSRIRTLTINAINLETFDLKGNIDKLSIRSNQLEALGVMSYNQIGDLSILSFQIPNHGCENVSPLKELNLANVSTVRQLHCPYLKTIKVQSMASICQLVDLDQTPLIEMIIFEKAFIEPDAFKTCLDYFENLKTIEFFDCNLGSSANEIIEFSSTIEVIEIYEGSPELIRFLTSLFSESPSMKAIYLMDTEVEETFIESISQPKADQWKNLELISLQNCVNISGKAISDFYSNIKHYASLKSLTLVLSPGNEIVYDARIPQTLESFTGIFNSVEIIPTSTARSNMVNLKTITLDGRNSTFSNFEINTFLQSIFDLFVDDKEEMAPFRTELYSLLACERLIADSESDPPDFKLINKVVAGIPSIRIVSKQLFTDDPVLLLSQRPHLKLCD
ncbi:predicted protein [Naegleria gruberi]|uniref:Predicted protein n=1 Tax=Naegleria gruberi TaxID=5762 RepID=D2VXU0_NAEGR|nr:uncharacterized protein NAEGRDRAFT_81642 [Naegleria gruberi]EFC38350.1 predicted protein [Naegleria gruberi]|eukprot:XP_002671094.1 predicted protein [Naegleria gruberi strain NEG-M]